MLNCLGKIYEKIITNRITYWAETSRTVANNHMGGRKQFSVEDAGVILTTWIRNKWREGKIVAGLFLDVKSAYPSVHKRRLMYLLHTQRCPQYLLNVVNGFLSDRTTNLCLQDYLSDQFSIENGLPQGSPLSVILYLLYNSPLLIPNNLEPKANEISIAFIDDVTHLVAYKDPNTLVNRIEHHCQRSLDWGDRYGAIFDKKKANLMYFTNKTNFTPPPIKFGEFHLQPQTQIRWLGFWLDPKLKFRHHIATMRTSGINAIHRLRRLNKCFSGLGPKSARNLVTLVLRPKILFGSVVWLTSDNDRKVTRIWEVLLNAANRLILGAFKTSPTSLMKHDSYLTPFRSTATQLHYDFYCKRLTAPDTHPTKQFLLHELDFPPRSHHSCISHRIEPEIMFTLFPKTFETIHPHLDPPWTEKVGAIYNLELKREEAKEKIRFQLQTEREEGSTIAFTDGSFIPEEGCGAAAVFDDETISASIGPKAEMSNDEAELIALGLAIEHFQKKQSIDPTLHTLSVFSDSQSAIRTLHETIKIKANQYIIKHLKLLITQSAHPMLLKLFWVPGHEGIERNELADIKAKEAATHETEDIHLDVSLSALKRTARTFCKPNPKTFETNKPFLFRTPPKKIWSMLANLEKGRASIIFQLRSGNIALNAYLHKHNRDSTPSPNCSTCHTPETTDHFLVCCRRYQRQRDQKKRSRLILTSLQNL